MPLNLNMDQLKNIPQIQIINTRLKNPNVRIQEFELNPIEIAKAISNVYKVLQKNYVWPFLT